MRTALLVIDTLEPGGAERSLLETARRFRRWRPVVCPVYTGDALLADFRRAGVEVRPLDVRGRYAFATAVRRLLAAAREVRPDIIHSQLFRAGLVARATSIALRLPLVHGLTGAPVGSPRPDEPRRRGRRLLLQRLDTWTAGAVDRFVANSCALAEEHVAALGVPRERVRVIHRGREPRDFLAADGLAADAGALRSHLGLADGSPVLLHVGRLRPVKRQDLLIRSLPAVLARFPEARLLIAGDGPARDDLARLAEELGIGERVLLVGHRHDVPALLALADVFVFPSAAEGHPGALIEALLAAVPIVASDLPVHRETLIAEDGAVALLVPPGDCGALAAAVVETLAEPAAAGDRAARGRRLAVERFSIARAAAAHETLYDEVVAAHRERRG